MKKILSSILVIALALTMLFTLASCNAPSGTYKSDEVMNSGVTWFFKGSEVVLTLKVLGVESTFYGDYEIEKQVDGKLTIEFDWDGDKNPDGFGEQPVSYVKGDGYIEIAGEKYKKAD